MVLQPTLEKYASLTEMVLQPTLFVYSYKPTLEKYASLTEMVLQPTLEMVLQPTISAGERPQAAHLLRSWVRIPPGAWIFVLSVVCCQVEVSATS